MSEKPKERLISFINDFNDNDYPYENENIHFTNASNSYKNELKLIQNYIHKSMNDKAILLYLKLFEQEMCKLLLSSTLYALFQVVYNSKYYHEAYIVLKLAKEMNDKYTPYLLFDFDFQFKRIQTNTNNLD